MRANGADLFAWLEQGGYFFVCGDAYRMAKDVDQALHDIIAEHGKLTVADTQDYVAKLKRKTPASETSIRFLHLGLGPRTPSALRTSFASQTRSPDRGCAGPASLPACQPALGAASPLRMGFLCVELGFCFKGRVRPLDPRPGFRRLLLALRTSFASQTRSPDRAAPFRYAPGLPTVGALSATGRRHNIFCIDRGFILFQGARPPLGPTFALQAPSIGRLGILVFSGIIAHVPS